MRGQSIRRICVSLAVLAVIALASCEKKTASPVLVSESPFLDVEVVRVIDGDTFVAIVDGKEERCRILYIDTPERGEPGFDEATGFLSRHLKRGNIYLCFETPGTIARDRYGRLLVYVWVSRKIGVMNTFDSYDIGLLAIRSGWSPYYTKYGRASRDSAYRKAEEEAKKAKRGIWAGG